jgi:hypothetical protein
MASKKPIRLSSCINLIQFNVRLGDGCIEREQNGNFMSERAPRWLPRPFPFPVTADSE